MSIKQRVYKALFLAKNRTEQDTIKKTNKVKTTKEQAQLEEIKNYLGIK